jgi:hypothetical protein
VRTVAGTGLFVLGFSAVLSLSATSGTAGRGTLPAFTHALGIAAWGGVIATVALPGYAAVACGPGASRA